jgi:hypothetical protein
LKRTVAILSIILGAGAVPARADWLDALLPANHILDKLPLVDEAGRPVPSGLFTFEDFNKDGRKDLLIAHREAVAADKLDQPHPQVVAVCFFDPARKGYSQVLQDEGGPLKGVRVLSDLATERRFLVLEREDWQAETSVRVYTLGTGGRMDRVLETQSPWSHANVVLREGKVEVLFSSRARPALAAQAEGVYAWSETDRRFADPNGVPVSKVALLKEPTATPVVVAVKPTATPVPTRAVVAAKPKIARPAPKPAVPEPASVPPTAVVTSPPVVASSAAPAPLMAGAWWSQPFSAPAAYAKLRGELIPRRVKSNQLTPLGQEAKAFFDQLNATGIRGTGFSDYRAGYLTAVASELYGMGDRARGAYYLDLVLKYRPDFQEALDLKARTGAPATP